MVGYAHVRAGHGTGQGHAAEEDSGSNRLYCASELHSGLEMIWRLGLERRKIQSQEVTVRLGGGQESLR